MILKLLFDKVMSTSTGNYLSHISDDSYCSLRSSEGADAGLFPRREAVIQYLYPGNAKRFVKREPMSWLKCYPVILYTHAYTAIIASEFLQTHS